MLARAARRQRPLRAADPRAAGRAGRPAQRRQEHAAQRAGRPRAGGDVAGRGHDARRAVGGGARCARGIVRLTDVAGTRRRTAVAATPTRSTGRCAQRALRAVEAADVVVLVRDVDRRRGRRCESAGRRTWSCARRPTFRRPTPRRPRADCVAVSAADGRKPRPPSRRARPARVRRAAAARPALALNARHVGRVARGARRAARASTAGADAAAAELVALELREALDALGRVVGMVTPGRPARPHLLGVLHRQMTRRQRPACDCRGRCATLHARRRHAGHCVSGLTAGGNHDRHSPAPDASRLSLALSPPPHSAQPLADRVPADAIVVRRAGPAPTRWARATRARTSRRVIEATNLPKFFNEFLPQVDRAASPQEEPDAAQGLAGWSARRSRRCGGTRRRSTSAVDMSTRPGGPMPRSRCSCRRQGPTPRRCTGRCRRRWRARTRRCRGRSRVVRGVGDLWSASRTTPRALEAALAGRPAGSLAKTTRFKSRHRCGEKEPVVRGLRGRRGGGASMVDEAVAKQQRRRGEAELAAGARRARARRAQAAVVWTAGLRRQGLGRRTRSSTPPRRARAAGRCSTPSRSATPS